MLGRAHVLIWLSENSERSAALHGIDAHPHFDREVLDCQIEKVWLAEIHEIVLVHVAELNRPSAGRRDEGEIAVDLPLVTVPGDVEKAVGIALVESGVKYQFGLRGRYDTKTEKNRR